MAAQDYQLGQLIAAVTSLTKAVDELTATNKALTSRMDALENKYRTGRGVVIGLILACGFLWYGAKGMVLKLLGVVL
jgi:hypothetical protein